MCHGPNNTILACNRTAGPCHVAEFHFINDDTLVLSRTVQVQGNYIATSLCYAETTLGPLLFTSHSAEHAVQATNIQRGCKQWKAKGGQVDGKECTPSGLCYGQGRLYVGDYNNARVLVFDVVTGGLLRSIVLPKALPVVDVAWSEHQPHLIVQQNVKDADKKPSLQIRYFNIY